MSKLRQKRSGPRSVMAYVGLIGFRRSWNTISSAISGAIPTEIASSVREICSSGTNFVLT